MLLMFLAVFVVVHFVVIYLLLLQNSHTQQVSDEWTYSCELVFFPFSSDMYRGQKEQTKNNDYMWAGRVEMEP